jgi:hypothetical protein
MESENFFCVPPRKNLSIFKQAILHRAAELFLGQNSITYFDKDFDEIFF